MSSKRVTLKVNAKNVMLTSEMETMYANLWGFFVVGKRAPEFGFAGIGA